VIFQHLSVFSVKGPRTFCNFFPGEFFQQHIQNDLKREVKNGEPAIQRRNLKNVTTAHHQDFESESENCPKVMYRAL